MYPEESPKAMRSDKTQPRHLMMITGIRPSDFVEAPAVTVYSDAISNDTAIKEIDEWARSHGFFRTREYRLNVVAHEGKRLYMGVCFKPDEDFAAAAREDLERMDQRIQLMGMTTDSDQILRRDD